MNVVKAWIGGLSAAVVVMRCPPRPIYVVAWSAKKEEGSVVRKTLRGAVAYFDRTRHRLEMAEWPVSTGPTFEEKR